KGVTVHPLYISIKTLSEFLPPTRRFQNTHTYHFHMQIQHLAWSWSPSFRKANVMETLLHCGDSPIQQDCHYPLLSSVEYHYTLRYIHKMHRKMQDLFVMNFSTKHTMLSIYLHLMFAQNPHIVKAQAL